MMTLSQFAIAAGAESKWVQNAAALLDLDLSYSREEALWLGLVKRLHEHLGVPLKEASRLARAALECGDEHAAFETESASNRLEVFQSPDTIVSVSVALDRYLSDFSASLVRALIHYEPRRRGRPGEGAGTSAVQRAREYGVDLGLLAASLCLTPAERLRRLDRNVEFVKALRRGSRHP